MSDLRVRRWVGYIGPGERFEIEHDLGRDAIVDIRRTADDTWPFWPVGGEGCGLGPMFTQEVGKTVIMLPAPIAENELRVVITG